MRNWRWTRVLERCRPIHVSMFVWETDRHSDRHTFRILERTAVHSGSHSTMPLGDVHIVMQDPHSTGFTQTLLMVHPTIRGRYPSEHLLIQHRHLGLYISLMYFLFHSCLCGGMWVGWWWERASIACKRHFAFWGRGVDPDHIRYSPSTMVYDLFMSRHLALYHTFSLPWCGF